MEISIYTITVTVALVVAVAYIVVTVSRRTAAGARGSEAFIREAARIESAVREEIRGSRQELNSSIVAFQESLLKRIEDNNRANREELAVNIRQAFREFRESFDKNVDSFNTTQREKFGHLEAKQEELVRSTEKRLEQMRQTVDEKLQKTLNERLGQSFETVTRQLLAVQEGLGEMKSLASDVGGLKRVLSNVKMRGGIGEIQLSMLLEQILAPEQYEANVRTKRGSGEAVEFAIRLPGKEDPSGVVYLPVDAKFPKELYEQLIDAYDGGEQAAITTASRQMESSIKKMARDIRDKYIDPPATTDFAIMFLPFEGIYAEVVRRAALLEQLQREFKIVVTGPATLAAMLNSLQMGFRTLAIQKRSSEVWDILKAVKTEFGLFSNILGKAQEKILSANDEIDKLVGVRTRQINRKLKSIETLSPEKAKGILGNPDDSDIAGPVQQE